VMLAEFGPIFSSFWDEELEDKVTNTTIALESASKLTLSILKKLGDAINQYEEKIALTKWVELTNAEIKHRYKVWEHLVVNLLASKKICWGAYEVEHVDIDMRNQRLPYSYITSNFNRYTLKVWNQNIKQQRLSTLASDGDVFASEVLATATAITMLNPTQTTTNDYSFDQILLGNGLSNASIDFNAGISHGSNWMNDLGPLNIPDIDVLPQLVTAAADGLAPSSEAPPANNTTTSCINFIQVATPSDTAVEAISSATVLTKGSCTPQPKPIQRKLKLKKVLPSPEEYSAVKSEPPIEDDIFPSTPEIEDDSISSTPANKFTPSPPVPVEVASPLVSAMMPILHRKRKEEGRKKRKLSEIEPTKLEENDELNDTIQPRKRKRRDNLVRCCVTNCCEVIPNSEIILEFYTDYIDNMKCARHEGQEHRALIEEFLLPAAAHKLSYILGIRQSAWIKCNSITKKNLASLAAYLRIRNLLLEHGSVPKDSGDTDFLDPDILERLDPLREDLLADLEGFLTNWESAEITFPYRVCHSLLKGFTLFIRKDSDKPLCKVGFTYGGNLSESFDGSKRQSRRTPYNE
jgi:hypothetical protein